jgi:familyl 116 glycosyl hydrolase-like protein
MAKKLRQSEALGDGCQDGYQSEAKRVMKFQDGEMGAIYGMSADGQALHENEQVEEVWTGTTFAIASHMLSEGMREQAFHTASGGLQRRMEGSGVLLPHTGSLRCPRNVSRRHVYETRGDLVYGTEFREMN